MYVCLCKGVTDSQIREAVSSGASNLRQVRRQLGVASQCGKCACLANEIVNDSLKNHLVDDNDLFFQLA